MKEGANLTIRLTEKQLNEIGDYADQLGCSRGSLIREAWRQYLPHAVRLRLNRQILERAKDGDTTLLVFPGNWNQESKGKIKTYIYSNAFNDLENLGKKTQDDVMEFMDSSTRDGSILHKGQITTTDDGMNFICFMVNLVKVYCHFSPMQITILSVVK